jgi:hypothetical protein
MVEITTTKGALDDTAKQRLAGELSTLALALEAAPMADFGDADHMQALAWCFVNEQEVFVGGQAPAKPIYRVTVTVPEGAPGLLGPLAERGREKLVKRVTGGSGRGGQREHDSRGPPRLGPPASDHQRPLGRVRRSLHLGRRYGLRVERRRARKQD